MYTKNMYDKTEELNTTFFSLQLKLEIAECIPYDWNNTPGHH